MTTLDLTDADFVDAFESLALPAGAFRHGDHVRLAWVLLRADGLERATERIIAGLRRFAAHHGAPGRFDEALTRRYVARIAEALATTPGLASFAEFAAAHAHLVATRLDR